MDHRLCHRSLQRAKRSRQTPLVKRAGLITFWAIVSIPIFLTLLIVVIEVGNLWLGRVQLKNALEASALAAVKHWGDGGGGDTTLSRQAGNRFASSSVINGVPVDLSTIDANLNDTASNSGTDNADCKGVFVFGSVSGNSSDFEFNPCDATGCTVPANVLLDTSGFGTLAGVANNDWGISVQPTPQTPPGTYVTRVAIRLPNNFGPTSPVFDFRFGGPTVSNNTNSGAFTNKVRCFFNNLNCSPAGRSQADISGINRNDVSFSMLTTAQFGNDGFGGRRECSATGTPTVGQTGKVLAIDFCDPMTCSNSPFEPGDHIRFGALVSNTGASLFDGDDIGRMQAQVTVCFQNGTFITGVFQNTTNSLSFPQLRCSTVSFPPWGVCNPANRRGMRFPGFLPDQPPRINLGGNNGQSLARLLRTNGSGGFGWAVRAQATYEVPSVSQQLFGFGIGPFNVSASVDALYDCNSSRPRIYHLDNSHFNCSNPLNCP